VAVTEDTGGSTRHPAFQNHNFGYDPSRNHYPNQGNPGITYTNDQVGLNARSLADILLIDAAVLGTAAEHAAAAAKVAAKAPRQIGVGMPRFPFTDLALPADAYNFWGVRNGPVSKELEAKVEAAAAALESAGFAVAHAEWSSVNSEWFGRPVNAALDTLFGNRRINNRDYDGIGATHVHSFTGQVAEWLLTYTNTNVSLREIWDTAESGGDGHSPRGFLGMSAVTDESQLRSAGQVQAEKLRVWNGYFDEHGVDVIMTPGQRCDAITYAEMANSSIPLRVRRPDGTVAVEPGSMMQCNLVAFFAFKDVPIPKMMVPTGLDAMGRPTAVAFWGRAPPPNKLFDDAYAKTHDVDFLHTVHRLVTAMHRDDALRRVDPPTVTTSLAEGHAEL